MKCPDFILAGEARCGSTSLYECLITHPDVILPYPDGDLFKYDKSEIFISQKELRFFDRHWDKGLKWYKSRFPDEKGKIVGDASATYLFGSINRIKECIPEVKLLVLLRNPTDRLFSHYHHKASIDQNWKTTYPTIKDFINIELYNKHHMIERGIYVNSIKTCYEYFDHDQVLIIKSEDLFEKPNEILPSILEFLSLRHVDLELLRYRKSDKKSDKEARKIVDNFYRMHNKTLYDFIGRDMGW